MYTLFTQTCCCFGQCIQLQIAIALQPDLAARVFVLAERVLRQLEGRALVFVSCAAWRRVRFGGEVACLHIRACPGLPCGLVLCVSRLVPQDVIGVFSPAAYF